MGKIARKVNFYGHLADQYGDSLMLAGDSIYDIVSLMQANFSDFRKSIIKGYYAIVRGKSIEDGVCLEVEEVGMKFGGSDWEWFIIPKGCGAGGNGLLSFIAGAVLVVIGAYTENPYLISMGVSLMLGGASSMLTPTTNTSDYSNETPEEKPSIIYSGGVNNMEQGGPVYLIYGQVMAGSIVVSTDVDVVEYAERTVGSDGIVTDF
jgi:predicted phage tail protein